MDLKALGYFVSVFENGSISAAAKACFVAQPSISAAIQQLEGTLNSSLFIRHARGVSPTEQGQKLYPLAKQLLGQADAIKNVFTCQSSVVPFRLGLIRALGVKRMSLLLQEFSSALENVELTLVEPDDECDARIITQRYVKPEESFITMWRDNYVLALPLNHPLSFNPDIQLEDFQHLPFILRSPCEAWEKLENELTNRSIQVVTRARIQTMEYALGLVQAGVGCALLPNLPQVTDNRDIVLKTIADIDLTRTIGLAFSQDSETLQLLSSICQSSRGRHNLNIAD